MFRSTGANAVAKNQTRLAYEDKRDLYCSSCELRRYLDSVPPETPIRNVVDQCRVWESHADPEIRRVSKPGSVVRLETPGEVQHR